jgi:hypothetical protein
MEGIKENRRKAKSEDGRKCFSVEFQWPFPLVSGVDIVLVV